MNLTTIEMPQHEARKAFLAYKRSVGQRHSAEDAQIMRGYRELVRGRQLISLAATIIAGGVDERGLPRIAVMQADLRWCYLARRCNGAVRFLPQPARELHHNRRRGIFALPAGTLPAHGTKTIVHRSMEYADRCEHMRTPWSEPAEHGHGLRAMVPLIPPALRPAAALHNYAVLWEAEWQRFPEPPRDPALLRHIGGDLYAVLAIWELTDLERAVLMGRAR